MDDLRVDDPVDGVGGIIEPCVLSLGQRSMQNWHHFACVWPHWRRLSMNSDKGLFQLNQAAVAMSATMLDVKKSTSAFGKAMERLVMTTVHSATARTKIDRLTAVLDAVLDWPTEEVRPFAEQVYHLVNNPELTADDVRSGTLIHQQLQVLQGGDSLDRASRAEYEAIMDEYIRRQITQPPTTPRVV